jgi:chaperonin GroES
MSWQLASQIPEWEEETDKLLVQLPIVGEMVRKWWYDHAEGRPRCRLLDAGKFIVNDKVTSLADAPRVTEELPLYPSEIETRIRTKQYVSGFTYDKIGEDKQAPQEFIEQHTRLDLDEDGYDEPYVVTVHVDTRKVVRIVADYTERDVNYQKETQQVVQQIPVQHPMTGMPILMDQLVPQEVVTGINSIKRGTYFIPFKFLPSLDGGYHGTGLGVLLGDISDAINSIINMMLDAGHYASLGGGFIGSEFRMKGGSQRHKPGEWKMVNSSGGDVSKALVPVTFPGPDATLFSMLGMLIDAGREIASVQDVMTGDAGGRQQTATTTLALIEQGMMVFTAAYKRIFRSLKAEYALLARINRDTLDPQTYAQFHDMHEAEQQEGQPDQMGHNGGPQLDPKADYDDADMDIQPVADPRSVTKMQQAAKAQLVMQLAEMGLVDRGEAMNRVAEAMDIPDVEKLLPQPDPMQEQMQQMQMQSAQTDLAMQGAKIELTLAQIEETRANAIESLAKADSEAAKTQHEATKLRMDGLRTILEDERERLGTLLGSAGRMAGQSGNGAPAQGNGSANGAPQGLDVQQLLSGPAGAGIGAPGGFNGGGMV